MAFWFSLSVKKSQGRVKATPSEAVTTSARETLSRAAMASTSLLLKLRSAAFRVGFETITVAFSIFRGKYSRVVVQLEMFGLRIRSLACASSNSANAVAFWFWPLIPLPFSEKLSALAASRALKLGGGSRGLV